MIITINNEEISIEIEPTEFEGESKYLLLDMVQDLILNTRLDTASSRFEENHYGISVTRINYLGDESSSSIVH